MKRNEQIYQHLLPTYHQRCWASACRETHSSICLLHSRPPAASYTHGCRVGPAAAYATHTHICTVDNEQQSKEAFHKHLHIQYIGLCWCVLVAIEHMGIGHLHQIMSGISLHSLWKHLDTWKCKFQCFYEWDLKVGRKIHLFHLFVGKSFAKVYGWQPNPEIWYKLKKMNQKGHKSGLFSCVILNFHFIMCVCVSLTPFNSHKMEMLLHLYDFLICCKVLGKKKKFCDVVCWALQ